MTRRAIIIAAGRGSRLGTHTDDRPKCLVEVGGVSILGRQLEAYRAHGVDDLHIVRGYRSADIVVEGATYHENPDWPHNNILHSLFCAGSALEGPLLTSYSDILFTEATVGAALSGHHDITLVVDLDWARAYEGRDDHPVAQAELAEVDGDRVVAVGKQVGPARAIGEFIGLAAFTAEGTRRFGEAFDDLRARLGDDDPFHAAALFRKAYQTDLFLELIARGVRVGWAPIRGGWREIDTVQDLERVRREWVADPALAAPPSLT